SGRGMVMSEGAGAVLLQRANGAIKIEKIVAGPNFFRRSEAPAQLRAVISQLKNSVGFCIGSANGTFIDRLLSTVIRERMPTYSPKIGLGESVGASVLWQVIAAAQGLQTGALPGSLGSHSDCSALVLACGLNQQTGGLIVRLSRPR